MGLPLKIPRLFRREPDELTCEHVRPLASDYIEGELNETLLAKVQRHLTWCDPCQAFVATLAKTVGLLRALPKEEPPPSLRQRIDSETKH